jgi:predicted DNA-binding transcriptional regulator AlpA
MATTTTPAPTAGRLNVRQAARYAGVSHETWYVWLRKGALDDITHRDPSGRRYWLEEEVAAWLRNRCFATPDQAPSLEGPAVTGEAAA